MSSISRAALRAAPFLLAALLPAAAHATSFSEADELREPAPAARTAGPGSVISAQPIALAGSWGRTLPNAAYQLTYRTTGAANRPVVTVASVILPTTPAPGPRRLVAYQMAYDGLSESCRPSTGLTGGKSPENSMKKAVDRGWAVVTADYEGPNDAWVAGRMAGHAVLDAIRAAESFRPAGLPGARTQVGLMGYSGGGQATAWANELARQYAPELRIIGASQGGVPANPSLLAGSLDGSIYAGVMYAAIAGLATGYPEAHVLDQLNPRGQQIVTKLHQKGCIINFALSYPYAHLKDITLRSDFLKLPQIKRILDDNTLGANPPTAPTFMYHATDDHLLAVEGARNLARGYCAAGVPLLWKTGIGDHIGLPMLAGSQPLDYLADRFAGIPASSNCSTMK